MEIMGGKEGQGRGIYGRGSKGNKRMRGEEVGECRGNRRNEGEWGEGN